MINNFKYLGGGKFDLPEFIVKSDQGNFDSLKWKATCESIQVLRFGYRWAKSYEDGFSTHVIVMNQKWNVKSESLGAEANYSVLATGLSTGYTYHIGKTFYLYPTVAYTINSVYDGKTEVLGNKYEVHSPGFSGSIHAGFEF